MNLVCTDYRMELSCNYALTVKLENLVALAKLKLLILYSGIFFFFFSSILLLYYYVYPRSPREISSISTQCLSRTRWVEWGKYVNTCKFDLHCFKNNYCLNLKGFYKPKTVSQNQWQHNIWRKKWALLNSENVHVQLSIHANLVLFNLKIIL